LQGDLVNLETFTGAPTANGSAIITADMLQAYNLGCTVSTAAPAAGVSDITGMSQTFSVTGANAYAVVTLDVDVNVSVLVGAGQLGFGQIDLDGVAQNGRPLLNAAAVNRATVGGNWRLPLSAGSHTIKAQVGKTLNAGTVQAMNTHSRMTIQVFDLP
jgi:hypothetical protein